MKKLTRKEQLEYLREFLREQIKIYENDLRLVEEEYRKILRKEESEVKI